MFLVSGPGSWFRTFTLQGRNRGAVRVPTLLGLILELETRFFIVRAASFDVSVGCADHHFQSVVQGGPLMPASGGLYHFPGEAASH
jgi:hypothetical protein